MVIAVYFPVLSEKVQKSGLRVIVLSGADSEFIVLPLKVKGLSTYWEKKSMFLKRDKPAASLM